jgi:thiamine kinase-like enzyme
MLAWIQELGESISEQKSLPKELVERAQKFVHDHIDEITYTPKPTLVHNDIHQANLIVEKNDQGIYTIQALVDWEWACSTIALDDVFYIKDTVLEDKELERTFFLEYFQGERDNVDDFVLEYRIYRIGLALDTAAEVWVTHPPTDAEIKEVRTSLEENMNRV